MKRFHIARETRVLEIFEVHATNVDDAVSLVELQEARLLTSTESDPIVVRCWEKPTGLADPNE